MWILTLPAGTGHETYIARSEEEAYFIKLGVQSERYEAVASAGLTPSLITHGVLGDGTSYIIQPFIQGRKPSRQDYRQYLDAFASIISYLHKSEDVKRTLPARPFDNFRDAGLTVLEEIRKKWEPLKRLVPNDSAFVDGSIELIRDQLLGFSGSGLAASHNDICNANWLLSDDGNLYLIDLDSMSLDDPTLDIGATLWWYYPPELRPRFLEITGHLDDAEFQDRMRVRMAMHFLNIELPRPNSYDQFKPEFFGDYLVDFKAALSGKENPQGYS
jgi:thiamine kinase-like enzyme